MLRRKALREKPKLGADGHPEWDPDGKRQRFFKAMNEELDEARIWAAAAAMCAQRQGREGDFSDEEILTFIEWCDLRDLRFMRKIAKMINLTKERIQ
jgi:hypothetical protein